MNDLVKEIIIDICKHGYECFIVGGCVRDYLLEIKSNDYDLCTNASKEILLEILKDYNIVKVNYGTIVILDEKITIEITTYRKELKYYRRKPINYEYTNLLSEDLLRRDFTMNAICMDKDGKLIDLVNGINDLNSKIIRSIGNTDIKLKEDPLRMLRCIRFSACLDFSIEKNLELKIMEYSYLLRDISYERKKEEINKLIDYRRLDILLNYGLDDILEIDLSNIKYYDNKFLIWYNIDKCNKYLITKKDKRMVSQINSLRKLGLTKYNIYKYGLDISFLVGQLENIDIISLYNDLPIKCRKDINVSSSEILSIFKDNRLINYVYERLEMEIISGNLVNNHNLIMSYLDKVKHTIY